MTSLPDILAARCDPLAAMAQPWMEPWRDIPEDSAPPLAMSAPHPRAVGSYGAECLAWARREGLLKVPRWWQGMAITRQLEHDEDGALVWREVEESGPRRIGKSTRLRVVGTWRTDNHERIGEPQLSMLVSKDLAIGKEIHARAWRWAESRGWGVFRRAGATEMCTDRESPEASEGRWLLRAPEAVYGYDIGYGQVDEAWSVDPQAITDGLEPAMLERLWAQLHLTSTAHVRASSLMRRRLLDALMDTDPDVLLMLWMLPPGIDYADESSWPLASPYWSRSRLELMRRKYASAVNGEIDPEIDDPNPLRGWASQYLNVWPFLDASGIFVGWSDIVVEPPLDPVPLALGIGSSPLHDWLSLGSALDGERIHLAASDRRRGTERAEFVANVARIQSERGCPVLVRTKNFLIPDLEDAGVWLDVVSGDDFAQASTDLDTEVTARRVTHGDYPELNAAVGVADWRTIDNRRIIETRKGDVSMLEAVALALRGARTAAGLGL